MSEWDDVKISLYSCKSDSRESTSSWVRCVPRLTYSSLVMSEQVM